ncbi:hypothetical protein GOP47_0021089 [Adiantum capillus-veneris]|uniref:Uncharacterized protein n=1 Tax=Adiantum capillus-veneris TaxID=13818 RepID=A0A9D4Z7K3_ADICA|nr:hypothetical protein GOP47_0021089 [Adiantum capillus-veneris]
MQVEDLDASNASASKISGCGPGKTVKRGFEMVNGQMLDEEECIIETGKREIFAQKAIQELGWGSCLPRQDLQEAGLAGSEPIRRQHVQTEGKVSKYETCTVCRQQ